MKTFISVTYLLAFFCFQHWMSVCASAFYFIFLEWRSEGMRRTVQVMSPTPGSRECFSDARAFRCARYGTKSFHATSAVSETVQLSCMRRQADRVSFEVWLKSRSRLNVISGFRRACLIDPCFVGWSHFLTSSQRYTACIGEIVCVLEVCLIRCGLCWWRVFSRA